MIEALVLTAAMGMAPDIDKALVIQPFLYAYAEEGGDGTLPVGNPDEHDPKPQDKHLCPPTCMPCKTCVPPPRRRHAVCKPKKCHPHPPCPPPTTCAPRKCHPHPPMPHPTCAPRRLCVLPTLHTTCAPPLRHRLFARHCY